MPQFQTYSGKTIKLSFSKLLEKLGDEFVNELKKQLKSEGKVATGELIKSLGYDVDEQNNTLTITAASYLKYVDSGRKKGKMPPISAIQRWVKVKNIKFGKMSDKQTAFIIGRSIARKGIKPTNVINNTKQIIFKKEMPLISNEVKMAVNNAIKEMIKDINSK